jgi:hyperosmotically inducible protein
MKTQWIFRGCAVILFTGIFFPLMAAAVSDSVITKSIKSNLAKNEITHEQKIDVQANNGVVLLNGKVESVTEATQAIEIASSTVGVNKVDVSKLYVFDSSQPLTDTYITAKVKGVFLKNSVTDGVSTAALVHVKVETQNSVVYLSGSVKNAEQQDLLIKLAKSVEGVKDVKSALGIKN